MHNKLNSNIKPLNKKTFKLVFDEYFNALCAFGNKYIENSLAVEDMIQEVFISLWNKREHFNHSNAIKPFLYISVKNKCLNYLKHQSVVQRHENELIHTLESTHLFENHVVEEEIFRQLYNEIGKLPNSAQEIMMLALNGLKNKEIAEELNISVNTVKTQKKIAYSKLKETLSPIQHAVLLCF